MKNYILNSVFLLSIMLMGFSSYAFDFVIFGNVSDGDGNLVTQQEILFRTSNNTCDSLNIVSTITDGYGNYSINLDLEGDSAFVVVETYSYACYEYYSETLLVGNPGEAEVNFLFCSDSVISECDLFFYYFTESENPNLVYFNPVLEDSVSVTTFNWQFGDGTSSNEPYPEHLYADQGEYSVTLTANNDVCGEMLFEDIVYVWDDTINFDRCFADYYFMFDSIDTYKVYFQDASYSETGITLWMWDFGDGTTSYEQNPVHTYGEEGDYVVTLTIESGDVCTSTFENYVWIGDDTWYPEECQALFFTEYDYYDFLTAHFIDLSWSGYDSINGNGILAWQWNFGDGEGSAEQFPTHTYEQEGEYLVTLTIYTGDCTSSFQEVVYMEDWDFPIGDCQAFFYPGFDSTALAVQFYDLSIPQPEYWNWDFGDGNTSVEQDPYHIYQEPGIYMVSLVTGSDSCSSEFAMEIELFENSEKSKGTSYSGIIRRAFAVHANKALSINEEEEEFIQSNYLIYPNPVTDILNISFNRHVKEAKISIMNISGQTIKSFKKINTAKFEMSTSNMKSGIYFARISADGKITTLKFIK